MKDLNPELETNRLAEVINVEQQKKQEYIGSINLRPGHTLFEIDIVKSTIIPAEYETSEVIFNPKGKTPTAKRRKLITKEGCVYVPALNKANAIKRFGKNLEGM